MTHDLMFINKKREPDTSWIFSCQKQKFDHTTQMVCAKPEPVSEYETHKILGDFEIQIDNLIPARRLDLVII